MIRTQLYNELSNLYPESLRYEWDNDGIMCCDDLNKEVKRVLIALDVTQRTVDYAIENKFDLIISHHPLVFSSQRSLVPSKFTQKKLIDLIKADVAVFSFHTRLDAAVGGVNDTLATLLRLENITVDSVEPIGRMGELAQEFDISAFAENIKKALNTPFILYNGNKNVKKVYVCGGDGKDLISRAIETGADTLLTGRASYNTIIDATDMGLNIIEAGHFFTENPICSKIKNDVSSIISNAYVEIFNSYELKNI